MTAENKSTTVSPYTLLLFLTFLNVLNFVDRQLVAVLGKPISDDLDITDSQFGLLVGVAFVTFYTFVGIFLGTVADRWHRPRLIAIGLLIWSVMTAASGVARRFWHIFTARLLVGVGEATLTPAAISMLSDVFRPKDRALASGVYYAGIPLGAGASLLIAGEIVGTLGYSWRASFYVLGGLGVILSLFVWLMRDAPRGAMESHLESARTSASQRSTSQVLWELQGSLRWSPALVLTVVAAVVVIFSQGGWWFIPKWIMEERGFSQQELGRIGAAIVAGGGLVGSILGGVLSDLCHRRWRGGRLYFIAAAQLLITPFLVGFVVVPADDWLFYFCWFMASISLTLPFGPVFASVQDLVPPRIRSTMIALLIFCLNILGTAPGTYVTGLVSDTTGDLTNGLTVVFLSALLSVPLFVLAGRRYWRDVQRLEAEAAKEIQT